MMNTRVERVFNFALYTALVICGLQLLTTVTAKPLPAEGATDTNYNATTWKNQTIPKNGCKCNSTNLTMIVDGNFLYKWRASFDSDLTQKNVIHMSLLIITIVSGIYLKQQNV